MCLYSPYVTELLKRMRVEGMEFLPRNVIFLQTKKVVFDIKLLYCYFISILLIIFLIGFFLGCHITYVEKRHVYTYRGFLHTVGLQDTLVIHSTMSIIFWKHHNPNLHINSLPSHTDPLWTDLSDTYLHSFLCS